LPIVEERKDGLRTLATAAAEQSYAQGDLSKLVHGTFTALGDGRVKIVYDFTNAAQGLDFKKQPGYMNDWYTQLAPTKKKEAQSEMAVANGAWRGIGQMCYRYRLGLAAPFVVRCTYNMVNDPTDDAVPSGFSIGTCDDLKESCIECRNTGGITVEDKQSSYSRESQGAAGDGTYVGQTYRFEIHHDGEKVATWIDDKTRHQASCGPRTSGGIFFWIHTDYPLEIHHLELEGAPDAGTLEALKKEWVAKTIAELGFK